MKLWIGGEIEADVVDSFCLARMDVEERVNDMIVNKDYGLSLKGWDCIAIVRNDAAFEEIAKYSPKKRDMDFRLIIDYGEFKAADERKQRAMICSMLLRSLSLLQSKAVGVDDLRSDVMKVVEDQGWGGEIYDMGTNNGVGGP